MDVVAELGLWISAFYVLSCYSFLYKYNRFFKFAEHTIIGAAAGHSFVMGVYNVRTIGIGGVMGGNLLYILAFPLGITLFARFTPRVAWLQRYGLAFMVGTGTAIGVRAAVVTGLLVPIAQTINKVSLMGPAQIVNSVILVGLTTTTMLYFLFTERYTTRSKAVQYVQRVGRWGILTAIGFYLGQTVMTRLAFVINRLEFLLFEWLRIPR